jgi:CobQ-like glutamine amidotransferase family enzyme
MRKIRIGYLYGNLMNLYGDRGNILALQKRSQWRGIEVLVKEISVGDRIAYGDFDLFFFGGGQDQSQDIVAEDLRVHNGEILKGEVERGVPLLSICGGYQLLGQYYQPKTGPKIPGIGIFDAYTVAGDHRLVGNLAITLEPLLSEEIGPPNTLVGFENHSGKTYLGKTSKPLGYTFVGSGNNGKDRTEGCVYRHAIGCYLHGSLLPKNPHLADWLLSKALATSGQDAHLGKLQDHLELTAHQQAIERARQVG